MPILDLVVVTKESRMDPLTISGSHTHPQREWVTEHTLTWPRVVPRRRKWMLVGYTITFCPCSYAPRFLP